VGLATFDSEPRIWNEPRSGLRHYRVLERVASRIHAAPEETNLARSFSFLLERLPRRALIIYFTADRDTMAYGFATDLLARIARRHALIHVTFPDADLASVLDGLPPSNVHELHEAALAAQGVSQHEERMRELSTHGIETIEVPPGQLVPRLLDRYFRIKREERIA